MPIDDTNQEPATDSVQETVAPAEAPGDLLKAERLRLGFDEKYVADKLHITMHYVRSIEANRFDKLPGTVFAKGYIKSYATLLNMNVASVTDLFDEMTSQQKVIKDEASRRQVARRRSDRNKPWVYASVATFILGMGALWVFNQYFTTDEPTPTAEAPAQPPGGAVSRPMPTIMSQPIAQTPPPAPAPARAEPTQVVEPEVGQPVAEPTPPASTPIDDARPNLLSALSTLAQQPATAETRVERAVAEPEAATDADSDGRVIAIDGEGDDILRISFTGESWVEVNDSEAHQIYRDIREAGDVLEITGNAPFNVLVGDAPYTTMTLNGAKIDVSDNIRIDNSARLTVGL